MKIKTQVNDFLIQYGMNAGRINFLDECEKFISEMEAGLAGQSSLAMLCTYLQLTEEAPILEPVIVIDAGGTNVRTALVKFDEGRRVCIEQLAAYRMPGITKEVSKETFFYTLAEYLKPYLSQSEKIGFCFSYPSDILPNKDGKLLYFTKEIKVSGMQGECIGENLNRAMGINKKIVVLNDTAATLLGGKSAALGREFDSYIGIILGTGLNVCYMEKNENIVKAGNLSGEETIVNMESGGYAKINRGFIDLRFDEKTVNRGQQQLEKLASGAYQAGMIAEIFRTACVENLFSKEFCEGIHTLDTLALSEINDFLYYPYGADNPLAMLTVTNRDKEAAFYIINEIMERVAKIVAIQFASILLKTNKGRSPLKPVCITAEGTTFYKSKLLRSKVDYYIKKYLEEKMGLYCEVIKVEHANIIGSAIAGLTN